MSRVGTTAARCWRFRYPVDSELATRVAVMAFGMTVVITGVLLLYSLGLRAGHILHERELKRSRERWWPIIGRTAISDGVIGARELAILQKGSRTTLLREWCRFRALVAGSSSISLNALADKIALLRTARRLLDSRTLSKRLLGIRALGYLRDVDRWGEIKTLVEHPNITLSITAAEALVHMDAARAVGFIVPLIAHRKDWPRTHVGRILNIAGSKNVTEPLCRAIVNARVQDACHLLQFYESASINEFDSIVTGLLVTKSEPVLIAAALKAIRGHLPKKLVARLANHKIWYVRMQTANLLRRSGRREDYGVLEPLISDTEWWVRYRAAQAIVGLPFLGPNALRKMRDRQQDVYARDMLTQSMAEVGLA